MKRKVVLYPAGEDRNIILDFYQKSSLSSKRKIIKVLKHVEEYGLCRDIGDIKKLKGYDFWEIRILGKDNIRIFLVELNDSVYVLHILRKKTQATPLKDLRLAQKRLANLRRELDT
jgi:phage-related protein